MRKRREAADKEYEAQWADGSGSHHPDYDPDAVSLEGAERANRCTVWSCCVCWCQPADTMLARGQSNATRVVPGPTMQEELYNAIVADDVAAVYDKIEQGADVNFVFGPAYSSAEGYTPLMVATHRGRCVRVSASLTGSGNGWDGHRKMTACCLPLSHRHHHMHMQAGMRTRAAALWGRPRLRERRRCVWV